jgi:hypothetical protein
VRLQLILEFSLFYGLRVLCSVWDRVPGFMEFILFGDQ